MTKKIDEGWDSFAVVAFLLIFLFLGFALYNASHVEREVVTICSKKLVRDGDSPYYQFQTDHGPMTASESYFGEGIITDPETVGSDIKTPGKYLVTLEGITLPFYSSYENITYMAEFSDDTPPPGACT